MAQPVGKCPLQETPFASNSLRGDRVLGSELGDSILGYAKIRSSLRQREDLRVLTADCR